MNMGVQGPLGVYGYLHGMVRGILYFRVLCMGNYLNLLYLLNDKCYKKNIADLIQLAGD